MSAATIVPLTVPDGGHAGFEPPPQRNAMTPPLTPRAPKWMCAKRTDPPPVETAPLPAVSDPPNV